MYGHHAFGTNYHPGSAIRNNERVEGLKYLYNADGLTQREAILSGVIPFIAGGAIAPRKAVTFQFEAAAARSAAEANQLEKVINSSKTRITSDLPKGATPIVNQFELNSNKVKSSYRLHSSIRNSLPKDVVLSIEKKGGMLNAQGLQDHHIISHTNKWTKNHELFELANFNIQSRANKIFLPNTAESHPVRSIHNGRHLDIISEKISIRMDEIMAKGQYLNWTQVEYQEVLRKLITQERKLLRIGETKLNSKHIPGRGQK